MLASGVMLVCLLQSPLRPQCRRRTCLRGSDGWLLAAYWVTYFTALTGLNAVAIYAGAHAQPPMIFSWARPHSGRCLLGVLAAIVTGAHR